MEQRLLVFDTDYEVEGDTGVGRLFCKNEKGNTILVLDSNFKHYFYVEPKEGRLKDYKKKLLSYDFKKGKIEEVNEVEKDFFGEKKKLLKITVENPRDVYNIRQVVKNWSEDKEEYEYTIPFSRRYLLDKKIEPMNWILVEGRELKEKKGYLVDHIIQADSVKPIESDKEVEFRTLAFDLELAEEDDEERIIMVSLMDNKGLKKVLTTHEWKEAPDFVETLENEKKMIERFLKITEERNPSIIVGYNSDRFDFPKLRERARDLGLKLKMGLDKDYVKFRRRGRISSARMNGRVHIDLYDFVDHILSPSMKTEVLTLDAVAQELLGFGKKDVEWKEIEESWKEKKGLEKIAEYALRDAELTLKLSNHLLPQIFSISRLTGLLPFDAARYTYSQLVERYLIKKAAETDVLIPNRPKYDEIQKRRRKPVFKGAIVIEQKKGIHSDILVFDFSSLYPTIISSHNISPDTLNCGHEECKEKNKVPELGHHFCLMRKGFIPTHLEGLIKRRKKIKDKLKKVKKDSKEYKQLDNKQFAFKTISNASYGYMGYVGARWYCNPCAASTASFGRTYIKKTIEMAKRERFDVLYSDTDSCMVTLGRSSSKNQS